MQIIVDIFAAFGLLVLLVLLWIILAHLHKTIKVIDFLEVDRFYTLKSLFSFSVEDHNLSIVRAYEQSELLLFWKVVRYIDQDVEESEYETSGFSLLSCRPGEVSFEFRSLISDEDLRIGVYRVMIKKPPADIYEHCRNLQFARLWLVPKGMLGADSP